MENAVCLGQIDWKKFCGFKSRPSYAKREAGHLYMVSRALELLAMEWYSPI